MYDRRGERGRLTGRRRWQKVMRRERYRGVKKTDAVREEMELRGLCECVFVCVCVCVCVCCAESLTSLIKTCLLSSGSL